jgi:hypothetical protein
MAQIKEILIFENFYFFKFYRIPLNKKNFYPIVYRISVKKTQMSNMFLSHLVNFAVLQYHQKKSISEISFLFPTSILK